MASGRSKKEVIETYFAEKDIHRLLTRAIEAIADERPDDPLAFLARWAEAESTKAPPLAALKSSPSGPRKSALDPDALVERPSTTLSTASSAVIPSPATNNGQLPAPPPLTGWASPSQKPSSTLATPRTGSGGSDHPLQSDSTMPALATTSSKNMSISRVPGSIVVIMAANKGSKESLLSGCLDELAGVAPPTGSPSADLAAYARAKIDALKLRNVALSSHALGASAKCVAYLDIDGCAVSNDLVSLASISDVLMLVVSARHGLSDMQKKREGELYNRAGLAHALGLRRAILVVTDLRELPESTVQAVETEIDQMMHKCGFDSANVRTVRAPLGVNELTQAVVSLPVFPRPRYVSEPVTHFKATVMVLLASGITVGDFLTAFCCGMHMTVRVDAIPLLIDRKTSAVAAKEITSLRMNQCGSLQLSVVGSPSKVAYVAITAPFTCLARERVLATGTIADVESLEESDESVEEFEVGP